MAVVFTENFDAFTGAGFAPTPGAGQLDSDFWRLMGLSDGDFNFGETRTTGDFARGLSNGGVTTGGVYAFDIDSGAGVDRALGVQPTGDDLTPGSMFLKVQNTTGFLADTWNISFALGYLNDQARSQSITFSYSTDGVTFTQVTAADFTTPLAADALGWQTVPTSVTVTASVAANDFIYFRWTSDDAGGAGSRDEIALDDVVVDASGPPLGSISIAPADAAMPEGDTGTTAFTFTVTRVGDTTGDVTLDWSLAGSGANPADADDFGGALPSGQVTILDGQASATITVQVSGDGVFELPGGFTVTIANPPPGYTLGAAAANGTIQNDDVPDVTHQIAEIQGKAHLSPFVTGFNTVGALVVTEGVVTARDTNGFYLQDATPDGDRETSDAIFVFTGAAPAASITVGESVIVRGNAFEFRNFNNLSQTQITNAQVFESNVIGDLPRIEIGGSSPDALRPPTTITDDDELTVYDPANDGIDFWESVESMVVQYNDAVVSDGFWFSFNGFYAYSDSVGATQVNSRGGLTVDGQPGVTTNAGGQFVHDGDFNPERIQVDFSESFSAGFGNLNTEIDMGDRFDHITGIVKHDFTNWKLFAIETPVLTQNDPDGPDQEVTGLTADPRSLRVATFNVENLDALDPASRFSSIATVLKNNLLSPDVIVVEEMQDNNGAINDGTVDASQTWELLLAELRAQTGVSTWQWVDETPVNNAEGGEPGGNIRVGFIYNSARVQLGDGSLDEATVTIADRRLWTDRIGDGVKAADDLITVSDADIAGSINTADWAATRLSLLGQFTFNGNTVFITGNHWPSKGGSGAQYQFNQDHPANPANGSWAKRKEIAEDVYTLADHVLDAQPNANIVIGGDLNEFQFFDPLRVLGGEIDADGVARPADAQRFVNLTLSEIADPAERFTFMFDGNAQALDHMFVDPELAGRADYDIVHVNTGYNSNRVNVPAVSDHDPVLGRFDYRSRGEVLAGTEGADTIDGFGGDDRIAALGGNDHVLGSAGNDTLTGGEGNDRVNGGDGADSLAGDAGRDTVTGGIGDDFMSGGDGFDFMYGEAGGDTLAGDGGGDYLAGGSGNDSLAGGDGADVLLGEAGNDTIDGGAGVNTAWGGSGDDRYVVTAASGTLVINDFRAGGTDDAIRITAPGFTSFADVQARTTNFGALSVITIDADTSIWLLGVNANQLTAGDFILS
jgi:hypothetical protein